VFWVSRWCWTVAAAVLMTCRTTDLWHRLAAFAEHLHQDGDLLRCSRCFRDDWMIVPWSA